MGLAKGSEAPEAVSARTAAARYYEDMNALLSDRDYLAGSYSFADIAFYMAHVLGARMGAPMTDATPALLRWRDRITIRPAVRAVVGPMMMFLSSRGRSVPDFLICLGAGAAPCVFKQERRPT